MASTRKPLVAALNEIVKCSTYFDIYSVIFGIFSASHKYFEEWKHIAISELPLSEIIKVVRKQEEVAQLKGLGLWLLEMIVNHDKSQESVNLVATTEVLTDILNILVTQVTHAHALRVLVLAINSGKASYKQMYSICKSPHHLSSHTTPLLS